MYNCSFRIGGGGGTATPRPRPLTFPVQTVPKSSTYSSDFRQSAAPLSKICKNGLALPCVLVPTGEVVTYEARKEQKVLVEMFGTRAVLKKLKF